MHTTQSTCTHDPVLPPLRTSYFLLIGFSGGVGRPRLSSGRIINKLDCFIPDNCCWLVIVDKIMLRDEVGEGKEVSSPEFICLWGVGRGVISTVEQDERSGEETYLLARDGGTAHCPPSLLPPGSLQATLLFTVFFSAQDLLLETGLHVRRFFPQSLVSEIFICSGVGR